MFTDEQGRALEGVRRWHHRGSTGELRIGGLAGTGKTTVIAALPDVLGLDADDIRFCAPTGKAAKVLTSKLPDGHDATTVHRVLYRAIEEHCHECAKGNDPFNGVCHGFGRCGCGYRFQLSRPDPPPRLIVVDESSMVSAAMYDDLRSIGSPLLFVGDHGQLPPVETGADVMREDRLDFRLETVHRQEEGSSILQLAKDVREGRVLGAGYVGDGVTITRWEDWDGTVGSGPDELTLCYTNKRRAKINTLCRQSVGYPKDELVIGDRLLCLRNNFEADVVNGTAGTVVEVERVGSCFDVVVDVDGSDVPYRGRILASQLNSPTTMMETPRWVDLWAYGYCLTVHKAQGSEADEVLITMESFHPRMTADERRRWLYTAITRARRKLTVLQSWRLG